jgi:hypothetical protein
MAENNIKILAEWRHMARKSSFRIDIKRLVEPIGPVESQGQPETIPKLADSLTRGPVVSIRSFPPSLVGKLPENQPAESGRVIDGNRFRK